MENDRWYRLEKEELQPPILVVSPSSYARPRMSFKDRRRHKRNLTELTAKQDHRAASQALDGMSFNE